MLVFCRQTRNSQFFAFGIYHAVFGLLFLNKTFMIKKLFWKYTKSIKLLMYLSDLFSHCIIVLLCLH
jgi:hypothetical protein